MNSNTFYCVVLGTSKNHFEKMTDNFNGNSEYERVHQAIFDLSITRIIYNSNLACHQKAEAISNLHRLGIRSNLV